MIETFFGNLTPFAYRSKGEEDGTKKSYTIIKASL